MDSVPKMTTVQMGLFTGATIHEVAHVVGAGNAMGQAIYDPAIIVKMIRVMMLAPVLVILSIILARRDSAAGGTGKAGHRHHAGMPGLRLLLLYGRLSPMAGEKRSPPSRFRG